MQNFGLENHPMVNSRQPFCWKCTSFTKVSNPFLPLSPKNHLMLTTQILIGQSFLKPFGTIGDKTFKGRGKEFVSTYPHPERTYKRTDVRTYVRWRHDHIFSHRLVPNFYSNGGSTISRKFQQKRWPRWVEKKTSDRVTNSQRMAHLDSCQLTFMRMAKRSFISMSVRVTFYIDWYAGVKRLATLASWVLFKLPKSIHNSIYAKLQAGENSLITQKCLLFD